uniref:Uncharacterized protein n=1 Tax=Meloidogyne incognita TaxID=6306 RepID=A0A914MMW3_MELIC
MPMQPIPDLQTKNLHPVHQQYVQILNDPQHESSSIIVAAAQNPEIARAFHAGSVFVDFNQAASINVSLSIPYL